MAIEHSAEITRAISRFEAAWARGESPQLDSFISPDDADNIDLIAELIAVDLERRLKAGESICVEAYLERFPLLVGSPGDVVNLIVAEYRHRCRQSPELSADEYLQRFPQFRDWLLARLSAADETLVDDDRFATQAITPKPQGPVDETSASLLKRIVNCGLVSEQTIDNCRETLAADKRQDDQLLIQTLLKVVHLTRWQLKQLRAGQQTFLLEHGRYLLLDELGKGGMGSVYRARHVGLNRDVALKTIDPKQARNSQLIARFEREIAVSAKLQHEHIVQAYDMGCHEGVHFLVLEYVEGADLSSIVKRDGPLPPAEVAAIGLQIAAALVYAHAQGVVHRDIKPHNILLSIDGVSKLLDLGLASDSAESGDTEALTSLTQTGMVLGTADYMPPEQAADLTRVDGRSDIYSLGATLYYLLTGRPPFPGGDMMSKMHRLANEIPTPIGQLRPDCPRELTDVVECMMAKRPEGRYQSTVDVVHALQPLAADRIAGRNVVTHAVQTAAEADTAVPHANTVPVTPFEFAANDTVATRLLQPRKESSLGKWLIVAATAVPIVIGISIWMATSGNQKSMENNDQKPEKKTPVVNSSLHKPPSQYYIAPRGAHVGDPRYVGWAADGLSFATSADDGEIRVWDASRSAELRTRTVYTGHRGLPAAVTWFPTGPDSDLIASNDGLRQLHVWNSRTGKREYIVDVPVFSKPAIRPDGKQMAFLSTDGIVLWSVERRKLALVLTTTRQNVLQYSPSGRYLALSSTHGPPIEIWDLESRRLDAPSVMVSFDGLRVAGYGGTQNKFAFVDDNTMAVTEPTAVKFIDLTTGDVERMVQLAQVGEKRWGHALSKDARKAIVWTEDSIKRIDLEVGAITTHPHASGSYLSPWISSNSLSPGADRQIVMRGTNPVPPVLLDFRDDTQRQFGKVDLPYAGAMRLIGGRFLYVNQSSTHKDTPAGWDLRTAEPLYDLKLENLRHTVNAEGTLLILKGAYSAGAEHHVEAWPVPGSLLERQQDFASFEQIDKFIQGYGAGFINKGAQVWMLSSDRRRLRLWDTKTGKVVGTYAPEFEDEKSQINVFPGSQWRYRTRTTSEDDTVEILLESIERPAEGKPVVLRMPGATSARVGAISSDETRAVTWSRNEPVRVFVFDTADGRKLSEIAVPEDRVPFFTFQHLLQLSRGNKYLLLYDQIYDLQTKPPIVKWECPPHSPGYFASGLLGDEQHVVVRMGDRYEVWDYLKQKKQITIFLLPQEQWFLFNHETHNWNASNFAHRFVTFPHRDASGEEEWVAPHVYQYRAEWENEPRKAALPTLKQK